MAAIRTQRRLDADDENQFIGNESVRRESSMSIHSRLAPDRLVSQHLVLVLGVVMQALPRRHFPFVTQS